MESFGGGIGPIPSTFLRKDENLKLIWTTPFQLQQGGVVHIASTSLRKDENLNANLDHTSSAPTRRRGPNCLYFFKEDINLNANLDYAPSSESLAVVTSHQEKKN